MLKISSMFRISSSTLDIRLQIRTTENNAVILYVYKVLNTKKKNWRGFRGGVMGAAIPQWK